MKKEYIVKTVLGIIGLFVLVFLSSHLLEKRYENYKQFFVQSCVKAFYYDNGNNFNEIVSNFTEELPRSMQDYIGREFLGWDGYLAYIDPKNIEHLCGNIFDFYQEAREENRNDYCEQYRCR